MTEFFSRWATADVLPIFRKDIGGVDITSTKTVTVDYGTLINFKNIKKVTVKIVKDGQAEIYEAGSVKDGTDYIKWDATQITILFTTGGFFDTTEFNNDTINRGEVIIWT